MTLLLLVLGLARGDDYQVHRQQAELHVKRGYWSDALDALAQAMATPRGRKDHELYWMAAQVCWELLDVETAMAMAWRAAELAPDAATREQAEIWAESLEDSFGFLYVEGPHPGMNSRMQLELSSTLFDPELKRYVNQVSLAWRNKTDLPVRVGLPVGEYLVNGQPISVGAGEEAALTLPMRAMGTEGLAALQVTRLELSTGVVSSFGSRSNNLVPSPRFELGVTQPVGLLTLGASLGLSSQLYRTRATLEHDLGGWSLAARVGREIVAFGPFSARPGLVARGGWLPGIALSCDGGGTEWTCGSGLDDNHELYATALALGAGAELLVEYREAGRTTSLGTGVRLGAEQTFGFVPSTGKATTADGTEVTWTGSVPALSALRIEMVGIVALAF